MSDIAYCRKCDRIKHVDEDCNYLGCNPELEQREVPAGELYVELREMHDRLAAAEQRATESDARATKAATYLRQTYSDLRAMALSAGHTRDALGIVTSLRIDAPVLFRIQSRLDAACADCDAFSVAPATQPDERAATEQNAKAISLCRHGLRTDGGHHKQWFLEQILLALTGEQGHREWEEGIPP